MSTSFSRNGHAEYDDSDWQASIDYINDHQRFPRDQRTPCANPDCAALSAALFCSERCREQVEREAFRDRLV